MELTIAGNTLVIPRRRKVLSRHVLKPGLPATSARGQPLLPLFMQASTESIGLKSAKERVELAIGILVGDAQPRLLAFVHWEVAGRSSERIPYFNV